MDNNFEKFLKPRNFISLILIVGIIGLGFYFWQKKDVEFRPSYSQTYRLVNEKISQSAAIAIHLPAAIAKSVAQENVKFEPEIKGKWLKTADEKEIVFQPKEKLKLNRYYSVQLAVHQSEETIIKSDFLAVENPEIIAIFPQENSEAPETSEITIIFNRPMVPLTTLEYLEEKDVPVEITPATEGRFKWITTRNLQFIPKEKLRRSSHYKIKIKSGLTSMDGLELKGVERKFTTRKLRYVNLTKEKNPYNRPISIYFNQPVDLEKIKNEISLKNTTQGRDVPFIIEYAFKSDNNSSVKKEESKLIFGNLNVSDLIAGISGKFAINLPFRQKEEDINKSVILVYNKKDEFGREKFWDFENNYSLTIRKAYPLEGDIILAQQKTTGIYVPNIIKSLSAESEKTRYADLNFFDPQGKLQVNFYEDVNLSKSKIINSKIKNIAYGEKCENEEQKFSSGVECEKIPDKKRIYITFQSNEIGLGEKIEIKFEKVVNVSGLIINKNPIVKQITSYPEFKILKAFPADNSFNTNVTQLVLCGNSPIFAPAKEDYKNYFKANLDYEFNSWLNSRKITTYSSYNKCEVGEFSTRINYGLMPLSDYSIDLKLEDVFGQKLDYALGFTTGKMPSGQLNFYHFQKNYNVSSPEKTKLTYAVKNMPYVDVEICKLESLDFLYKIENKPRYYDSPSSIAGCQETTRDRIELPSRYWIKNYFQIDIKDYFKEPIGHYIFTFSNPNYKARWGENKQIYERSYLTITNLAVAEKKIQPQYANYGTKKPLTAEQLNRLKNLYWVTSFSDLKPVSGAKVSLYRKNSASKLSLVESYLTNSRGLAFTDVIRDLRAAIITNGKDSAIIPSWESKLDYASSAFSAEKIFLYTDKAIYRPDQDVFIKGIYRIGYDGNYEIFQGKKINLKVFNSKRDEIFSKDLEINDFGTFNAKFIIDAAAPLGGYRICAEKYSCIYFDVQEYVPAPFEVKVKTDKEEYISKDTANLEIDANYYFGVPLEAGEVSYTISSQNYYFDKYSDGYFNFGSRWYYRPSGSYGEKFILSGRTSLDNQGKAKISQSLDFEKLFKNKEDRKSKIIVVDITVKNPQGRSVSSQKSFIVHNGEFYLGLKADKSFLAKNEKTLLKVKSVDIQGKEKRINNIALNLYKINWIYSKRQGSDGGYHYNWEKERKFVKKYNFNTDKNGNYALELEMSEEGRYEAEASVLDKRDNLISTVYNFYVYGWKEASVRPTKNTKLELETEKTELNVGEQGSIIIKSPYPKAKALIAIERGKIFEYQIIDISGNFYNYKFTVKEEYLPNVYVSVLLLSSNPEVKFGKINFKINTERKKLDISVRPNKDYYLPGENVVLNIWSKDYRGRGVSSEVSVAVVDLSVLAFKGNPKKNPLVFFYNGFPLTVSTASNIKNILEEVEIHTKGGGGLSEKSLARKKRGIFKDTAFWQAEVKTDKNGRAQVKFVLPDNLTKWQAETIGITEDTKLGVNYQEFTSKKELMIVPLKPRFVVPGDIFYIGAKIFNQSQETQKLKVKFASQTLILKDDKNEKKITIKSGKTGVVYFQTLAPAKFESGEHQFVLSAKGSQLKDAVEQSISITANNTYEAVATANYTSDSVSKEYVFLPDNIIKDKGSLSIKSSATLAVFLSDSLNYLLHFPYGCSEQVASKLGAIAIVQKGLNIPNITDKFKLKKIKDIKGNEYSMEEIVEIGLAKIYNNQMRDGGFSYWGKGDSNFYLTLHIIDTLNNLSSAGFNINQDSLKRGSDYLYKKITTDSKLYNKKDTVILTAYTLFNLPDFSNKWILKERIIRIINNDLFINEQISNNSLAYLAILLSQENGFNKNLKNNIFEILENRIDIDSRGAFLESGKNVNWQYYETPIKNTALYLKALSVDKRESPILDKILRWLLNNRSKDGAWGSTNNTITVIDAFSDFLQWKKETESNFTLDLIINDRKEDGFDFNPKTILDQFSKKVSLSDLEFNKNNTIEFLKTNRNQLSNNLYYDLSLKYYLPVDKIPPRDEGFSITREFYAIDDKENKKPIREAKVGDIIRGHIQITAPKSRKFVGIKDYIPAGMEIVNLDLATEQKSLRLQEKELKGREFIPEFKEIRDDQIFLYKENLNSGVYEFDYYARVLIKGKFTHLPAVVSEMYFPEVFGRTDGRYFEVK